MSRALLPIGAALALLLVASSTLRLHTARSTLDAERQRNDQLSADVLQLATLRDRRASAQLGEPPEADLLRRVRDAMSASGLAPAAFAGLSTNADESIRGSPGHRRKSYRLELTGLDATDLGSLLDLWRDREPLWSIEAIELRRRSTRTPAGRGAATAGGYAATLRLSTIYAAPAAAEGPAQP